MAGVVLARAGLDRTTPLATTTLVVASNLPDIDILVSLWGDLAYLEHHRGVTHSIVGLLIQGPILAGAVFAFDRGIRMRRNPDAEPTSFGALVLVALVGLFAHLLLDWTNSYGVRPMLPFDERWFYGDLVFIVDPWIWLMLGGALFVGSRRHWATNIVWGLIFAAMSGAVALSLAIPPSESGGPIAVTVWAVLLAVVLAVRARWSDIAPAKSARVAIAAVVVYWGCLTGTHAIALRTLTSVRSDAAPSVVAIPTLMRPDRWRGFTVGDAEIRSFDVEMRGDPKPLAVVRRNLDDERVRAAMQTCPGTVAVAFSRLLFAETTVSSDGTSSVLLRDARFSTIPGRPDFATTAVPMDAEGQPATDERPCPRGVWPW